MRHFRFAAPAVLFVLLACGGAPAGDGTVDLSAEQLALPDRETFGRSALIAPTGTRSEMRERWGDPDSIFHVVVPNRHVPAALDTLFTVHYPALIVGLHRPGPGGELLSAVTVYSNTHLQWPVIGAAAAQIEDEFGPPDRRSDDRIVYDCMTCIAGNDPVEFFLAEGRVDAVRFNFYVD